MESLILDDGAGPENVVPNGLTVKENGVPPSLWEQWREPELE
jgi:hypothetical protein